MKKLPIVAKFNEQELEKILNQFGPMQFQLKEKREDVSGDFPMHTRYFSNGDKPLVALINLSGLATFGYENDKGANILAGEFIFFDDSLPHSWRFQNCNLEIMYYRFSDPHDAGRTDGDYCLDNFFNINSLQPSP